MSRDFFNEAAKNTVELQKQIIPETYKYYKFIRTPKEMGMSTKGGMKDLQDNVAALVSYGELLISGGGAAVEGDQSLGNRYFLKTGGQCNANGSVVDRYVYVDNLPHGGIPMSDNTFIKYQKFRGIIPGMLQDIEDINTAKLFRGFMEEEHPTCRDMTLETIDVNNARAMQTRHIADSDIREMNACSFPSRKNPITGVTCGSPPDRPPLKDQILARTNFGGHIDPACGPAADAAAATHPHVLHHPGGINEASGAGAVTPPGQIQTAVQSAGAPGTSSSVAGGGSGGGSGGGGLLSDIKSHMPSAKHMAEGAAAAAALYGASKTKMGKEAISEGKKLGGAALKEGKHLASSAFSKAKSLFGHHEFFQNKNPKYNNKTLCKNLDKEPFARAWVVGFMCLLVFLLYKSHRV